MDSRQSTQGLDLIIILGTHVGRAGTPGPVLKRRLETALGLLEANPQAVCIVTGGHNPKEPVAEAVCMAAWLEAAGIDPTRIIQEDRARSTVQNFVYSKRLLPLHQAAKAGVDPSGSRVALVTSNFHCPRTKLIAKKLGLGSVRIVPAPTPFAHFAYNVLREPICMIVDKLNGNL